MARSERETAAERFGELFKKFGDAMGDIMDDPELRAKAKEFSKVAVDAAARVIEKKIKDEEIRKKFRNVGEAAQNLGESLEKNFKAEA